MKGKIKLKKDQLKDFEKAASFNDVKFDSNIDVLEVNGICSIEVNAKSQAQIFEAGVMLGQMITKKKNKLQTNKTE